MCKITSTLRQTKRVGANALSQTQKSLRGSRCNAESENAPLILKLLFSILRNEAEKLWTCYIQISHPLNNHVYIKQRGRPNMLTNVTLTSIIQKCQCSPTCQQVYFWFLLSFVFSFSSSIIFAYTCVSLAILIWTILHSMKVARAGEKVIRWLHTKSEMSR